MYLREEEQVQTQKSELEAKGRRDALCTSCSMEQRALPTVVLPRVAHARNSSLRLSLSVSNNWIFFCYTKYNRSMVNRWHSTPLRGKGEVDARLDAKKSNACAISVRDYLLSAGLGRYPTIENSPY